MTQSALNQAIARTTGESVRRIRRMGFRLLTMPTPAPPSLRPTGGAKAEPKSPIHLVTEESPSKAA